MTNLLKLTIAFYDAAWDFSTRLCMLPDQLNLPPDADMNPETLIQNYKQKIFPFLDLQGKDIPKASHITFDQIHTTMQREVFPALEVMTETWNELRERTPNITHESRLYFAEQCVYIGNLIEMYVIAQTSEMRDELRAAEPA